MLIFLIFVSKVLGSVLISLEENAGNCGKYCASCFKDNMCTKCTQGRVLVIKNPYSKNGVCVKVPDPHCFFISPHKCYLCYGDEGGEGCCGIGCKSCSNNNSCKICEEGYSIEVSDTGGSICRPMCPHGVPSTSGECLPCHDFCESCSRPYDDNSCLLCYDGRVLERPTGRCLCPSGMAEDVKTGECRDCDSTCEECIEPGDHTKCSECDSGLYLYHGSCVDSCPDRVFANDNTRRCESYHRVLESQEEDCSPGWRGCDICIKPANGPSYCHSCHIGFYLTPGIDKGCSICHANCRTCEQINTHCTSCKSDKSLIGPNNSPGAGFCVFPCPEGTASTPAIGDEGGICLLCDETCKECSMPDSPDHCTVCDASGVDKRYLSPSESRCLKECPYGYGGDDSTARCVSCIFPCKDCRSPNFCTDCYRNYVLKNGECRCPDIGYYLELPDKKSCRKCHKYCRKCIGPNPNRDCSECNLNYFKGPRPGRCSECLVPYIKDSVNMFCLVCHPSCKRCRTPSNRFECISCSNPHKVIAGDTVGPCIDPLSCPVGTAVGTSSDFESSASRCLPCHSTCFICTEPFLPDKCLECIGGINPNVPNTPNAGRRCSYCPLGQISDPNSLTDCKDTITTPCDNKYLEVSTGDCVPYCASNEFTGDDPKKCYPCDSSCKTCIEPYDDTKCTSCPEVLKILFFGPEVGKCIDLCPSGTVEIEGKCHLCSPLCKTCGPTINQCITCRSDLYILESPSISCLLKCPSGYYADTHNKCQTCNIVCTECRDGSDKCIECAAEYDFNAGGHCVLCVDGTVYSITEKKCLPCHFTCGKCSFPRSNNHCITCASGLVLSGTTCLSTCPDGYYLNLSDCSPCDPTCLTCIGTHDSCLQCAIGSDGKQLLKILHTQNKDPKTVPGTCVQSCPSNTYLNPQKTACLDSCPSNTYTHGFECLACDPSCLECLLPEDSLACTVCKRYLRVNTLTFNKTLSQFNGGILYGECVDICSSKDIKDDNICYAYKDREESYMKEIEFMRGRVAGVISDSLV